MSSVTVMPVPVLPKLAATPGGARLERAAGTGHGDEVGARAVRRRVGAEQQAGAGRRDRHTAALGGRERERAGQRLPGDRDARGRVVPVGGGRERDREGTGPGCGHRHAPRNRADHADPGHRHRQRRGAEGAVEAGRVGGERRGAAADRREPTAERGRDVPVSAGAVRRRRSS